MLIIWLGFFCHIVFFFVVILFIVKGGVTDRFPTPLPGCLNLFRKKCLALLLMNEELSNQFTCFLYIKKFFYYRGVILFIEFSLPMNSSFISLCVIDIYFQACQQGGVSWLVEEFIQPQFIQPQQELSYCVCGLLFTSTLFFFICVEGFFLKLIV